MYEILFEQGFQRDYRRVKRLWPGVGREFSAALELLRRNGVLPEEYGAHELANPGGNYNGHIDFHLSDGEVDVIVLHMLYKTSPSIRFIRMGRHDELFQGSMK